jgi:hypothetical protein
MSKLGATKNVGALSRAPEPEEPVTPHPPVLAYVLERDGGGWRPSIYRVPASILVAHGELVHTHEPDLKGLALEQLVRHIEERTQ